MIIHHKKTTPFELVIPMVDASAPESFKIGLFPSNAAYYKDGTGTWTTLTLGDSFSEIAGTGLYAISLSGAEMNHDWMVITATAPGAADTLVTFRMFHRNIDDTSRLDVATHTVGNNV